MSLRMPSIAVIVASILAIACGALGGYAAPVFVGVAGLATGAAGLFVERIPEHVREKSLWVALMLGTAAVTLAGVATLHPFTILLGLSVLLPSLIGLFLMPVGDLRSSGPAGQSIRVASRSSPPG